MTEKILINGMALDLKKGAPLSFEIESNIMKKVEDLSCCYSYTYSLPSTVHNRSVLGDLLRIGRTNPKARKFLRAEYYRDGLLIFVGNCYVEDATLSEIEVRFLFGIIDGLQRIKDEGRLLNDLYNDYNDIEEDISNFHINTPQEIVDYKVKIPFGGAQPLQTYPFQYVRPAALFVQDYIVGDPSYLPFAIRPAVHLERIFELINEKYGLTFNTTFNKSAYWLQTADRRRKDCFSLTTTYYKTIHNLSWADVNWQTFVNFRDNWVAENVSGMLAMSEEDHGGRVEKRINLDDYDKEQASPTSFYPFVNITMDYTVEAIFIQASGFNQTTWQLRYYPNFEDDGQRVFNEIARGESLNDSLAIWYFPRKHAMQNEFSAGTCPTLVFDSTSLLNINNIEVTFYCSLRGEEIEQSWFNAIDCLPDIKLTDFINDVLFGINGSFPINTMKGGTEITCQSLDDIVTNAPYNWTEKLLTANIKVADTIDGLNKKNKFTYRKGDLELDDYLSVQTRDDSLEDEGDWYASNFGKYYQPTFLTAKTGSDARWYRPSPKICSVDLPAYYKFNNVLYAVLKNENMRWLEYDSEFKNVMREPFRIECTFKVSSLDLATLDLTKPVYLEQFGAKFFISKLSVAEDTADAVLVKL